MIRCGIAGLEVGQTRSESFDSFCFDFFAFALEYDAMVCWYLLRPLIVSTISLRIYMTTSHNMIAMTEDVNYLHIRFTQYD